MKLVEFLIKLLLQISLWGNKCDLSISVGVQNSQLNDPLDALKMLRPNILVNETDQLWQYLQLNNQEKNDKPNEIAVVLDNAGFELFTDLCLIDFLQESNILPRNSSVNFYVKEMPWFVSDVMKKDFNWTLEYLCEKVNSNSLNTLGCKWKNYFRSGKWKIIENQFWTLPHDYSAMENVDNDLYKELQASKLVLFKGDLNYRKLAGDLNWDFQVPLSHALRGFLPTTICSLRTIKADVVCGIHDEGVLEKIKNNILPKDWMTTGEYGLIQVVKK